MLLAALALALSAAGSARLRHVAGSTPHERGRALGTTLGAAMQAIYDTKLARYSETPGAIAKWHAIANHTAAAIARYAPNTMAEIEGAASALSARGTSPAVALMLAVEYELLQSLAGDPLSAAAGDKCTGYAGVSAATPGSSVSGQNNDEDPSLWLDGRLDVVLHYDSDGAAGGAVGGAAGGAPAALVYTHPGYPAYMGVNARGLAVLWQYIDDGERDYTRVPTCVMLRELLVQPTIEAALALLREARVAVPNNIILSDATRVANVEVSPSRFTLLSFEEGDVVHTNHYLFDQGSVDHDLSRNHSRTTLARFDAMRAMVRQQRRKPVEGVGGVVPADALAQMLSTAPVLRNATHGTDNATLASMVFEPATRRMRIRFKADPWGHFLRLELAENGTVQSWAS